MYSKYKDTRGVIPSLKLCKTLLMCLEVLYFNYLLVYLNVERTWETTSVQSSSNFFFLWVGWGKDCSFAFEYEPLCLTENSSAMDLEVKEFNFLYEARQTLVLFRISETNPHGGFLLTSVFFVKEEHRGWHIYCTQIRCLILGIHLSWRQNITRSWGWKSEFDQERWCTF